jgi:galactarate dehydratase
MNTSKDMTAGNPIIIKIDPSDNVAIVANDGGLKPGTKVPGGVVLKDFVPQGHKFTLEEIEAGGDVVRYGEVIGQAVVDLPEGSWLNDRHIRIPEAPSLEDLPLATRKIDDSPALEGYTFEGYRNLDGSVGTKNVLGIMTSVQCVTGVADHVVRKVKSELLHKYPNVDDVIAITHSYGCGVAIQAPNAAIPIRTLMNLARNPNLGGEVLVVGLGCEKLQPDRLVPKGRDVGANVVCLQDIHEDGFEGMIARIMEMVEERLVRLDKRLRETCPVSDLVIGVQCGGSDAFSGITANPAVGFATDRIVKAGGTVLFSEVTEVRDAVHLLTPRVVDEEVGKALIREMSWYDNYLEEVNSDRTANPTPGNKIGGLSNIVEKALGSIVKSGTCPISDVLGHGERVKKKGLVFAATPASDFVCGTQQLASGIVLQVFTTGRGTPYGLAMAPVVKVSSRTALSKRWFDLIDLDAGRIATGEADIETVGEELFQMILEVASGRTQTAADKLGLANDLVVFNPAPIT